MLAAISRTALRRAPTTSLSSSYSTTPLSSFQVVTSGLDDPKDIELNQAIKALDKDVDLARHKTANKKTQYHEKGWMKKKRLTNKKVRNRAFNKIDTLSNWIKYDLGRFHPFGDPKLKRNFNKPKEGAERAGGDKSKSAKL